LRVEPRTEGGDRFFIGALRFYSFSIKVGKPGTQQHHVCFTTRLQSGNKIFSTMAEGNFTGP
jgi:hypothetical protein